MRVLFFFRSTTVLYVQYRIRGITGSELISRFLIFQTTKQLTKMEAATGDKRMHDEENCAPDNAIDEGSAIKQARSNEAATNPLLSPAL